MIINLTRLNVTCVFVKYAWAVQISLPWWRFTEFKCTESCFVTWAGEGCAAGLLWRKRCRFICAVSCIFLPPGKAESSGFPSFSGFLQALSSTGFESFHEGRVFSGLPFKDIISCSALDSWQHFSCKCIFVAIKAENESGYLAYSVNSSGEVGYLFHVMT